MTLTGPSGISAILHDNTGGSEDDVTERYSSGSSGTQEPVDSLSRFVGTNGTGTWTLEVTDDYSGDQGQLESWGLELTCI